MNVESAGCWNHRSGRGAVAVAVGVAVAPLLLVGCSGGDGGSGEEPGGDGGAPRELTPVPEAQLVFARDADSVKLDPATITDGESVKVCSNIYEGLLEYSESGTDVLPCLAESWQMSDDGKVYTFKLRQGVKFHDGTDFDAAAVVTNFARQQSKEHPYNFGADYIYWGYMFANVFESIEATDDTSVKITLQGPHAPFLANMAMFAMYMVSPAALEKHGVAIAENPVGTGPFHFVRWVPEQEIILARYDGYWRDKAKAAGVKFLSIKDPTGRLTRMQRGEFHFMQGLLPQHLAPVEKAASLRLLRKPGMNVAYLSLNHRNPPFDDVRVRRAVSHAIRKQVIAKDAYKGTATPAKCAMPPTLWGYNDDIEDYAHDPEQARALLAEAGVSGVSVDLYTMQNGRPYMPQPLVLAQMIKEDLKAVGIEVNIHPTLWAQHLAATQNAEHDMALLGWMGDNGDPDNFLYALLDKDNAKLGEANNISFYESDELHDILLEAQEEPVQEKRAALYRQAQVIIHRDVGFIPLVHSEEMIVLDANIRGFVQHPTGTMRLRNTWLGK